MTTQTTAGARGDELLLFFVGAYSLTWAFWLPAALAARQLIVLPVPSAALLVLGGLGPMVAAIGVTARDSGGAGVRALLGQALRWRVRPAWYAIALLGMGLLALAVIPIHVALGGTLPGSTSTWGALLPMLPLLFVFVALLGGGLDEELGWRGYALPRLQRRYHPLVAALILGPLWAGWHLPLWATPGLLQARLSFPLFAASTTMLSILFAWIYNGTGGSLLLVILAHTTVNVVSTATAILLDAPTGGPLGLQEQFAHTALTGLVALTVVLVTGRTLSWTDRSVGGSVG